MFLPLECSAEKAKPGGCLVFRSIIDHPEYAGIAALSVIISHSVLTRFSVLAVVCPRIV